MMANCINPYTAEYTGEKKLGYRDMAICFSLLFLRCFSVSLREVCPYKIYCAFSPHVVVFHSAAFIVPHEQYTYNVYIGGL